MKAPILGFILSVLLISVVVTLLFGVMSVEVAFLPVLISVVACMGLSIALGLVMTRRI